jgi:hypothetical protein
MREIKKDDEQARVACPIPILVRGKNSGDRAFVEKTIAENVTRRGLFFCTSQPLQAGSTLRIYSVNEPARSIAKVEVVWVREESPSGVGTKLVGDNQAWMKFLMENSIAVIEDQET